MSGEDLGTLDPAAEGRAAIADGSAADEATAEAQAINAAADDGDKTSEVADSGEVPASSEDGSILRQRQVADTKEDE